MPINLKIEYPKLEAENIRLKRLLHDLTPGGSEFYNDPEYCAKWIRENREQNHYLLAKQIKSLKDNKDAAISLAIEFGYKQCEKGENIQAAFINYNELTNKK